MKPEEKHIIWSNYDLDYDDWKDDLEADYPDLSEQERIALMYEINCDYLQNLFTDYFYFEKVCNETTLRIDYRDYEKDASLKGEFIRMVMGSDLSEEQKTEVIRCGILALSGEEI